MPAGGSESYDQNVPDRAGLGDLYIHCIHSFFAAFGSERDLVAFPDIVDQTRDVNEDFLFGGVVYNKAKAFGFIEELYCSTVH